MIGYISGKIIDLQHHTITILPESGVGYEIGINESIFAQATWLEKIDLFVHHHITENSQSLFGFIDSFEKTIFRELIKISGVGWKVAMQILTLGVHTLVTAVKNEDNKTIESIKWVGKKMAEKIIIDLKDKDFNLQIIESGSQKSTTSLLPRDLLDSIKDTLTNMWYNPRDIEKVFVGIPEWMQDASEILPYMIKELS